MIELDEFVRATLESILRGVSNAQAGEHGSHVNAPHIPNGRGADETIYHFQGERFTLVDFEVAVSGERKADGKAAIKVFGLDLGAGGGATAGHQSKISFAVPVRIPGKRL